MECDWVGACFLFRGLTQEDAARVREHLPPPERFEKGTAIYAGTSYRRAVGVVASGVVRVCRSGGGTLAVLNRLFPGDAFGVSALYGRGEGGGFATVVTAEESAVILFIEQNTMDMLIVRYPQIAVNYITFLSDRIRFLNHRIAGFTETDSDHKVWRYLCANADSEGQVEVRSLRELAQSINVGRSSLYRSLDALAAQGYIRRSGRKITLQGESI